MADDDLIARAKAGDPDAWRSLYRAHAGRLRVWLDTRPTGDAALSSDDVVAETWLLAAQKIHDFTGTTDEFVAYLFGVARNIRRRAEDRSRRRRTEPGETVGHWLTIDDPTLVFDQIAMVREVLATLSARERDVVGCVDVVGLDVATTARALGISEVAVRVARHRGLRRLRSRFALPVPF